MITWEGMHCELSCVNNEREDGVCTVLQGVEVDVAVPGVAVNMAVMGVEEALEFVVAENGVKEDGGADGSALLGRRRVPRMDGGRVDVGLTLPIEVSTVLHHVS